MPRKTYPDDSVFNSLAIDPETEAFNLKLEQKLAKIPPPHTMTLEEARKTFESGQGWMRPSRRLKNGRDLHFSALGLKISLRIFLPQEIRGIYLHIHGGGFVTGRPHHFDDLLNYISFKTNLGVVSVDYRLAPENPHPAAADDCEAAAAWLIEHAKKEFGSDRLFIGGESAGANLAALTLIRMRDKHGFKNFIKANLVYGCFDLSMTPSQRNWGDRNLVISTPTLEWYNRHYAPAPEQRRNPDISPLYAELNDLPTTLFTIGTFDPLLDDTLFMHARWIAAGNQAELAVYPGGVHAFTAFPTPIAKAANHKIIEFLKD